MMKRIAALILSAMMVFASMTAFAAVGDVTLYTDGETGEVEAYFMGGMNAAIGDTMYLLDYTGSVYAIRPGQAAMDYYPLDTQPFEEEFISLNPCALFAEGDTLKALFYLYDEGEDYRFVSTTLYRIVLSEGGASLEKERDVDWDDLVTMYEDGESYPLTLENVCYNQGKLFVFFYEEGMGAASARVLDLESGDMEAPDLGNINMTGITAYKDGFLLLTSDYENGCTTLIYLDPNGWRTQEISRDNWDGADYVSTGGPVWDEEGGRLFFCEGKALYGVQGTDMSTKDLICDMPAETYNGGSVFLKGGYYALASEAVVAIRNVDKTARPTERMTIMTPLDYNTTVNKAFYEFLNTHGDIDPVILDENASDKAILESFMNRDDSVDVYILYMASSAFTTLYRRNYMAPIKSDALRSEIEEMYPVFRDLCMKNGEVVCYPLEVYSGSTMAVNENVLERLGMTLDDIPRDWTGFLKWCEQVNASLEEDSDIQVFEPFSSQSNIRYSLISMILQDYLLSLNASGDLMRGFDSQDLRDALQAVADMDLEAMGIPESIDWDNWDADLVETKETLISTWGNYLLRDLSWNGRVWSSLGLSVGNTGIHYPVYGYAAFVNPYSKHQQEAAEFIEALSRNTEQGMHFTYSPKDNEPIRYSYYETNLKYYESTFENLHAQIEATTDAETLRSLEEYMAEMEEEFAYFESTSWEISPDGFEAYAKVVPDLVIRMYGLLDQEQMYTLLSQAANGEISMDDFVRNLNTQMNMMLQEGN